MTVTQYMTFWIGAGFVAMLAMAPIYVLLFLILRKL